MKEEAEGRQPSSRGRSFRRGTRAVYVLLSRHARQGHRIPRLFLFVLLFYRLGGLRGGGGWGRRGRRGGGARRSTFEDKENEVENGSAPREVQNCSRGARYKC